VSTTKRSNTALRSDGAGKSTFFNCLTGDLLSTSGKVLFEGQDITNLTPEARAQLGLARTFQLVQPFAGLTTLENVMVGAFNRARDVAAARRQAAEIVDFVGLGPRRDVQAEYVGRLSDRFNLIVYDGFYHDDNGAEQKLIPDNKVLAVAANGVEGVRYQGAVLDLEAQMQPRDFFVKTWLEKNPSGLNVLSQTAPLVAPRRPNASGVMTVA